MSPQSSSSSASADEGRRRSEVEVVFPTEAAAAEFVDDGVTAPIVAAAAPTAGSGNAAGDVSSVVAKALAELPAELAEQAQDPKRHARSKDPGWKYGFWPNEAKKEMVQCIFCKKIVPSGIKRFKQHLAGGYGDAEKCPKAPAIVRKEMHDYLKRRCPNVQRHLAQLDEILEDEDEEINVEAEATEQPQLEEEADDDSEYDAMDDNGEESESTEGGGAPVTREAFQVDEALL